MSDDPFAPNSDDTNTAPSEVPSPADEVKNAFSVEFTLKAGSGYEAEWIKPKVFATTAEEAAQRAADLLNSLRAKGVFEMAAEAGQYTRNQFQGKSHQSRPQGNSGNYQRQQRPRSNGGSGKSCEHGEMNYREGNKNGKQWKAYFCPDDVCKPTWVS